MRSDVPRLVAVLACAAAGAIALPAVAQANVTAYNEPAYTKTSGNNAFWFNWVAVDGLDSNGNTNYTYYHCLSTYHNNIQEEFSNGTNGPGSTNCTGTLRNGPSPSTGNSGYQPYQAGTVLQDGHRYEMCATGYRPNVFIWQSTLAGCANTVIDRTKPSISAGINGTDEYTRNPVLSLRIDYNDATSPPWFGSDNRASNWVCFNNGSACTPGGSPNANCSVPNAGFSQKVNSFNCQADVSAQADGKWYFCARSGDQAVPDNPSGTNQFASATSNNANISDAACGYITLDRAAPAVTAGSDVTTATVGQLVSFSASATDGASGVSGQYSWTFGDNTAAGTGATPTHTYTQPGTYVAKVTTTDGAGNTGEATRTITVNPAASNPGGGTPNPGGGTPPPGGGTTIPGGGTTTPGGATTTPGTSQGTTGATPINQPLTPTTISQQNGGGGSQSTTIAGLSVMAPKTIKFPKVKSIVLALTPNSAGAAKVALLKGSKIVSTKSAKFGGAGTYSLKMKLPKKVKGGSYVLQIAFTPAGEKKAVTKTLKLKITVAKKSRKKAAAQDAPRLEGASISRSSTRGESGPR